MQMNKLIHLKRCTWDFPSRFLVKSCLWQFSGQRLSHTKRSPSSERRLTAAASRTDSRLPLDGGPRASWPRAACDRGARGDIRHLDCCRKLDGTQKAETMRQREMRFPSSHPACILSDPFGGTFKSQEEKKRQQNDIHPQVR